MVLGVADSGAPFSLIRLLGFLYRIVFPLVLAGSVSIMISL